MTKNLPTQQIEIPHIQRAKSRAEGIANVKLLGTMNYLVIADAYRAAREEAGDNWPRGSDANWADEAGIARQRVTTLSRLWGAGEEYHAWHSWRGAEEAVSKLPPKDGRSTRGTSKTTNKAEENRTTKTSKKAEEDDNLPGEAEATASRRKANREAFREASRNKRINKQRARDVSRVLNSIITRVSNILQVTSEDTLAIKEAANSYQDLNGNALYGYDLLKQALTEARNRIDDLIGVMDRAETKSKTPIDVSRKETNRELLA